MVSRNSPEKHLRNFVDCTRGILFLGTPHSGSGLARWAEAIAKSIGFIKQSNTHILEVLKAESEVLARIQSDFHTMLRARVNAGHDPLQITCFYEELPLPGIGEVRLTTLLRHSNMSFSMFHTTKKFLHYNK